ncbi:MAG: antibiotic biosynthesis monooxygenase [Tannerellaceae bacterium]|jgi:quinol monooxygenase YgiN|nr:antibiotic biosynthesis monooxygenase [Tannerellaceae bacterium]
MKKLFNSKALFAIIGLFLLSSLAAKEMKSGDELLIIAHVTTKAEYKDELMKAFEKVVEGTRQEAGNISYDLYVDTSDPLKFTIVELWKSQDAINIHNETSHFKEFVKAIDGKADLDVRIVKQKL